MVTLNVLQWPPLAEEKENFSRPCMGAGSSYDRSVFGPSYTLPNRYPMHEVVMLARPEPVRR